MNKQLILKRLNLILVLLIVLLGFVAITTALNKDLSPTQSHASVSGGNNWSACTTDTDCLSGLKCVWNFRPSGSSDFTKVCSDGNDGNACSGAGNFTNGGCIATSACINTKATRSDNADSYICGDGRLNDVCTANTDCDTGLICKNFDNVAEGRCSPAETPQRTNWALCDTKSPCAAGFSCVQQDKNSIATYCTNGANYNPCDTNGSACSSGLKCISLKPLQAGGSDIYRCTAGQINNFCGIDSDCVSGLVCKKFSFTGEGRCSQPDQSKRTLWSLCDADNPCAAGLSCVQQDPNDPAMYCTGGNNYEPCSTDQTGCSTGLKCVSIKPKQIESRDQFRCTAGGINDFCGTNADCQTGFECYRFSFLNEGRCSPIDKEQRTDWPYCDSIKVCATGSKCIENYQDNPKDWPDSKVGLCSSGGDGVVCNTDNDCKSGFKCTPGYQNDTNALRCKPDNSIINCGKADTNGDGKVDIIDYLLLAKYYRNTCSQTANPTECNKIDTDNSGVIDILDFIQLAHNWQRQCSVQLQ